MWGLFLAFGGFFQLVGAFSAFGGFFSLWGLMWEAEDGFGEAEEATAEGPMSWHSAPTESVHLRCYYIALAPKNLNPYTNSIRGTDVEAFCPN